MAEQTLFAHMTLMAIGKNNEAKVMLRLASPALILEAMRSAISLSRFLEKLTSHSPFQRLVRIASIERSQIQFQFAFQYFDKFPFADKIF